MDETTIEKETAQKKIANGKVEEEKKEKTEAPIPKEKDLLYIAHDPEEYDWENYLHRARYFNKRKPKTNAGRRATRGSGKGKGKIIEELSIEYIKESFEDLEDRYTTTMEMFGKEWTHKDQRE